MEQKIIAFCGIDCAQCDGYKATQANDEDWKERIAAQWREQFNSPDINVLAVTCDSCLSKDGRLGSYCKVCDIRACGIEHQVANCAACAEYAACEKIAHFAEIAPQAKANLDALRGG
jgi:hypothetical protein